MSDVAPELIIVGRVRKAHGVRGDLVVEPLTDEGDVVFAAGRRVIAGTVTGDSAKGRPSLRIDSSSPFKGGYIVHFAEITDRDVADAWRERYLLLSADELRPLAADEVYVHELQGMRVVLQSGELVGTVSTTYELPQGMVLDVARARGSVLVPYERVVIAVDREARVIVIDPPAGLLEET